MAEDRIKFGNNNEISYSQLGVNINKDAFGNDKLRLLFDTFDVDKNGILDSNEVNDIWNRIKGEAKRNGNSIFETEEAEQFLQNSTDENGNKLFSQTIKATDLFSFIKMLGAQNVVDKAPLALGGGGQTGASTELRQKTCKETVVGIIDDNINEAEEILQSQNLGAISGAYDDNKKDDNKLKTSNVKKVLDYQRAGEIQLIEAKEGTLTRRAYYEENKQRIKDMILTRLTVLKSSSGVSFLDQYKNKYTKEQLIEIISAYVESICDNVEMDKLEEIQKQFVSFSEAKEISALDNFIKNAIDYENRSKLKINPQGGEGKTNTIKNPKGIIPSYWDSAEPITFEEVYRIERGTEYSEYKVEQYVLAKKEMEAVANAYNRKQQFVDAAKSIVDENSLTVDAKIQKIMELYSEFYALAGDDGLGELKKIIDSSNTLIKLGENGLDLSAYKSNEQMQQKALNKLLSIAIASKEKDFETFLGGKTIEEYQEAYEKATNDILGEDNAKMLADAMKSDNMTAIQRWTGNTSMAGMGMTVIGGVLCFTPLAPLGAGLVTLGNTVAITGMVAKTGLGVADYVKKDTQTSEELSDLAKDFVVDAGGFIIGMGAGKAGLKAFNKLIDKKLSAVFTKKITAGNRMQALQTVLKNPEYLKNFMTAAGAKISTDFMISYVGDLAMMGLLDTKDDWRSLLQANLTGILVGMSGDIKDVAGVGKGAARAKTRATSGTTTGKPMTQQDYAMSALGKEVTVKDPATGTKIEGSVTKVATENGEVKIEVNGKEYSTDNIIEIRDTQFNNTSPLEITDINKLKQNLSDENIDLSVESGFIEGYETLRFTKNNISYEVYCEEGKIKAFLADEGDATFRFYEIRGGKDLIEISEKELRAILINIYSKQIDISNSCFDSSIEKNIPNCDIDVLKKNLENQGIKVRDLKNYTCNDGLLYYTKDNVRYFLNYADGKIITGRASIPDSNQKPKCYEIKDDGTFIEIDRDKYLSVISNAQLQYLKIENPDAYNTIVNFEKALQSKISFFDLREYLDKMEPMDSDESFLFSYKDRIYELDTDTNVNVIGFKIKTGYSTDARYFIYDNEGKAIPVYFSKYADTINSKTSKLSVILYKLGVKKDSIQNIITHGDWDADVPRFNKAFVSEVTSLIKTPEDEKLFNILICNKTTVSKSGLNKYTFNSQEILNIMKSPQAKNIINEKIANDKSISRTDIEKIDKNLLTLTSSYTRSDKRDLTYEIPDWDEDPGMLRLVYNQHIDLFNSQVPPGEVICARGQLLCNTGDDLVPINLTKEKFMELFPIKDRFKINQGLLGDCWLVTAFGALMDSPKGRAAIYSMFRQDGNDIYIKFPDSDVELGFKNGNVNTLMPISFYIDHKKLKIGSGVAQVQASKGIRLLERAYSVHRNDGYQKDVTTQMVTDIFFMNKQMQRLKSGNTSDAIANIVGKNKVITTSYSEPDEIIRQIEESIKNPNKILTFSTKENGRNSNYDLYGKHAYHIVDYNKETGMISISNPWHNNKIQEIPIYEWLNYIGDFKFGVTELK